MPETARVSALKRHTHLCQGAAFRADMESAEGPGHALPQETLLSGGGHPAQTSHINKSHQDATPVVAMMRPFLHPFGALVFLSFRGFAGRAAI